MLETYLRERLQQRDLLLMTHIVIGYPDMETSLQTVEAMAEAGVDLMELQIPFSEPIADGPVILHANQKALAEGTKVAQCLDFAEQVSQRFEIPFLFMTYYNIVMRQGTAEFVRGMRDIGLKGAIVPDLPPEEAEDYLAAMGENGLDPIFIYSPNTSDQRLATIAEHAGGFIYCVARKGVTGAHTDFSEDLDAYLGRCRQATSLPLAVGFGVKDAHDLEQLRGKADIAVVGSQSLRVLEAEGVAGVREFVRSLRP